MKHAINSVPKDPKAPDFTFDKDFAFQKVSTLQGEVRQFPKKFDATLTDFMDLGDQENIPKELFYFFGLCLDKFLILKEIFEPEPKETSWWDWGAFAVAMIGLAQVVAGTLLCAVGCVNLGNALVSEGINDMVYATMAGISGRFSWKEWGMQKAISLAISIVSAGLNALASAGKAAQLAGSASRAAMFGKVLAQAAVQFAVNILVEIISDKVLSAVIDMVIEKIIKLIECDIFSKLSSNFEKQLRRLYENSKDDEEYSKKFTQLENNIKTALEGNCILSEEYGQIKRRVMSSVASTLQISSSGKFGKALKAAQLANQIWGVVEASIQMSYVVRVLDDIVSAAGQSVETAGNSQRHFKKQYIKEQADALSHLFRQHIKSKLTTKMTVTLKQVMRRGFTSLAKSASKKACRKINKIRARQKAQHAQKDNKKTTYTEVPRPKRSTKNKKRIEQKRHALQKKVKNPKEISNIKDHNRTLARADIKMLANRKRRTIEILKYDNSGQVIGKEVIRPSGLNRRLMAAAKTSVKINYQSSAHAAEPGHFIARNGERYVQNNGRNDCLLVAYNEARGRIVTEDRVRKQRNKLANYTARNQKTFFQLRDKYRDKGSLVGGAPNQLSEAQREVQRTWQKVYDLHKNNDEYQDMDDEHFKQSKPERTWEAVEGGVYGRHRKRQMDQDWQGLGRDNKKIYDKATRDNGLSDYEGVQSTIGRGGRYSYAQKKFSKKGKVESDHWPPKSAYKGEFAGIDPKNMAAAALAYKIHRLLGTTGNNSVRKAICAKIGAAIEAGKPLEAIRIAIDVYYNGTTNTGASDPTIWPIARAGVRDSLWVQQDNGFIDANQRKELTFEYRMNKRTISDRHREDADISLVANMGSLPKASKKEMNKREIWVRSKPSRITPCGYTKIMDPLMRALTH